MSYNVVKINNIGTDQNSKIPLNLDDVFTINSPANNEFLQKQASDWGTSTLPPAGAEGLLNNFDVNSPGNTTYRYAYEDNYQSRGASGEYDITNNVTIVTAWGSYVPIATSSWRMSYKFTGANFPAGSKILLRAVVAPFRFAGSNLTVQWYKGDPYSSLSSSVSIGNYAYSEEYGATAFGLYVSDGTDDYATIRVVAITGQNAITVGDMASVQQITAQKLA